MSPNLICGELISFKNTEGYFLDGILYRVPNAQTTVIHVHGSFGNFYHNDFLKIMTRMYLTAGFNFLSFNLLAHDGLAEAVHYISKRYPDEIKYVGYSIVDFSTCLNDIQGAINFVSPFSKRIILQGHSLGCDRVVYFLLKTNTRYDAILIGPSDSYNLQKTFLSKNTSETVEEQINRLEKFEEKENGYDWLPFYEYGIAQPPQQDYIIPITRKSLLSIMKGPPFKLFNIEHPFSYYIDARIIVYQGGCDDFLTWPALEFYLHLEKRFKSVTRAYFANSDHYMRGVEEMAIQKYIDWIKRK
jgi:pimeloyl-ACP methyl ester carboxylesterase